MFQLRDENKQVRLARKTDRFYLLINIRILFFVMQLYLKKFILNCNTIVSEKKLNI